jgi:hypothetical protein
MANPVDKEEDAPHKREETLEISMAKWEDFGSPVSAQLPELCQRRSQRTCRHRSNRLDDELLMQCHHSAGSGTHHLRGGRAFKT